MFGDPFETEEEKANRPSFGEQFSAKYQLRRVGGHSVAAEVTHSAEARIVPTSPTRERPTLGVSRSMDATDGAAAMKSLAADPKAWKQARLARISSNNSLNSQTDSQKRNERRVRLAKIGSNNSIGSHEAASSRPGGKKLNLAKSSSSVLGPQSPKMRSGASSSSVLDPQNPSKLRLAQSSSFSLQSSQTGSENIGPTHSNQPTPRRVYERKLDIEKRHQIWQIRKLELENPEETAEETMPSMRTPAAGFLSLAHLRSEEYWRNLLGAPEQDGVVFKWAEEGWFTALVSLAIGMNALLLGVSSLSERPTWQTDLCNAIYLFSMWELGIRGCRLAQEEAPRQRQGVALWVLDVVAVAGCFLEQWGLRMAIAFWPQLQTRLARDFGTASRLLWVTRFVRVVRMVPALDKLVRGILQALIGLLWVFALMFLLIFTVAVICTDLIGKGELESFVSHDLVTAEADDVRMEFQDVGSSMFVLFNTMSSWSLMPLIPLFESMPATRLIFSAFYVFVGWTLMAVMTGTVSFTMIAMKAQMAEDDDSAREEDFQKVQHLMREMFEAMSTDSSGRLTWQDLKALFKNPELIRLFGKHTNMECQDIELLCSFLDAGDQTSSISVDEFMEGVMWFQEEFKPQVLMKLQGRLGRNIRSRQQRLLGLIKERFDFIVGEVEAPLRKINAVTEQVQVLSGILTPFRAGIQVCSEPSPPGHRSPSHIELEYLESTLGDQIAEVMERLSSFEITAGYTTAADEPGAGMRIRSEKTDRTANSDL